MARIPLGRGKYSFSRYSFSRTEQIPRSLRLPAFYLHDHPHMPEQRAPLGLVTISFVTGESR